MKNVNANQFVAGLAAAAVIVGGTLAFGASQSDVIALPAPTFSESPVPVPVTTPTPLSLPEGVTLSPEPSEEPTEAPTTSSWPLGSQGRVQEL